MKKVIITLSMVSSFVLSIYAEPITIDWKKLSEREVKNFVNAFWAAHRLNVDCAQNSERAQKVFHELKRVCNNSGASLSESIRWMYEAHRYGLTYFDVPEFRECMCNFIKTMDDVS